MFAILVILTYTIVWVFNLGYINNQVVQILIFAQRVILQSFFIKFQFITLTELALHDITVPQPLKYYFSYCLSLAFQQVLIIELFRAYFLLKQRYSDKEINSTKFSHEKRLMHRFWTEGLKQSQIKKGNTYMVRDRARWSLIQMMIVGLQGLPKAQIMVIAFIQLVYFVVISMENKRSRIFKSLWLKLKILFQELAILVFLLVLCLFSSAENSNVRTSSSFMSLEFVVIVAMIVAVICEVLLMLYIIYDLLRQIISKGLKCREVVKDSSDSTHDMDRECETVPDEPVRALRLDNKVIQSDNKPLRMKSRSDVLFRRTFL